MGSRIWALLPARPPASSCRLHQSEHRPDHMPTLPKGPGGPCPSPDTHLALCGGSPGPAVRWAVASVETAISAREQGRTAGREGAHGHSHGRPQGGPWQSLSADWPGRAVDTQSQHSIPSPRTAHPQLGLCENSGQTRLAASARLSWAPSPTDELPVPSSWPQPEPTGQEEAGLPAGSARERVIHVVSRPLSPPCVPRGPRSPWELWSWHGLVPDPAHWGSQVQGPTTTVLSPTREAGAAPST